MAEHPEIAVKSNVQAWKNLGFVVLLLFAVTTLASHLYPPGSAGSKIRLTKADAKLLNDVYQEAILKSKILIPDPERAQFAPYEEVRFFRENGLIKIKAAVIGIDDAGKAHKGELTATVRFLPEISAYKFEYLNVVNVGEPLMQK